MRAPLIALLYLLCVNRAHSDPCLDFSDAVLKATELRALAAKQPIKCVSLTRAEFDSQTRMTPLDRNTLQIEELVFKNLGLIPESFDYSGCSESISQADALASYSPQKKSILVPQDSVADAGLLAHEAVHALQDQYFDLEKMRRLASLTTDSALALDALVEGDAVRIERAIREREASNPQPLPRENGSDKTAPGCTLPEIFLAQVDLSYFFGPLFVESVRAENDINSIFSYPPTTTSQILHPAHYRSEQDIPLKHWHREGGDLLLHDRLGEFMIRSLLKLWIPPAIAIEAATGWTHDDLALWQVGKSHQLLRWETSWESAVERDQFWEAILSTFERRAQVKIEHATNQVSVEAPNFPPFNFIRAKDSVVLEMKLKK